MKIYEACYCDCIYESSYATISIHKTKKGARKALSNFLRKERARHQEMYKDYEYSTNDDCNLWQTHKGWMISETELKN